MTYSLTSSDIKQFQSYLMDSNVKLNTAKKYVRDVKKLAHFCRIKHRLCLRILWTHFWSHCRKQDMRRVVLIRSLPVLSRIVSLPVLQICSARASISAKRATTKIFRTVWQRRNMRRCFVRRWSRRITDRYWWYRFLRWRIRYIRRTWRDSLYEVISQLHILSIVSS